MSTLCRSPPSNYSTNCKFAFRNWVAGASTMQKKRYEMLLPLTYNDGRAIEDEKFYETREELIARFDAVAMQPGLVQGTWVHEGVRYEDNLRRIVIDVDDTAENRDFFLKYKAILRERFQQLAIYIASIPIEII